ncbi:hypothetical protein B0O99DRAFT_259262 [Bisporella sp. PMI_857]|nr:hypothetical protein B0O99DRAFT_259262 [Bisporella sp. PMI_857]
MHFVRRAALRAASSGPSASFVSKSRSINTSSPFALRSKTQQAVTPSVFRRFAHEDAESKVQSADNEDTGAIRSAVNSASETTSTYASNAAESISQGIEQAGDVVADGAREIGAAAGYNSAPRERRQFGDSRAPTSLGSRVGEYQRHQRKEDNNLTPTSSIYIGNLLFDVTGADLAKEFSEYGTVKSAIIAQDSRGLSKGFGYVEFETTQQATTAIEARHLTVFEGRRLIVNYMAKTQRDRSPSEPSKTLFIGNLAFEMSDADLNKLFREIRNVIDVRVAIDRRTGQPRGFAHADFVDIDSATKAMGQLANKEVYGRKLRVDFSAGSRNRGTIDN